MWDSHIVLYLDGAVGYFVVSNAFVFCAVDLVSLVWFDDQSVRRLDDFVARKKKHFCDDVWFKYFV